MPKGIPYCFFNVFLAICFSPFFKPFFGHFIAACTILVQFSFPFARRPQKMPPQRKISVAAAFPRFPHRYCLKSGPNTPQCNIYHRASMQILRAMSPKCHINSHFVFQSHHTIICATPFISIISPHFLLFLIIAFRFHPLIFHKEAQKIAQNIICGIKRESLPLRHFLYNPV
jgi:hypothetical protein